MTAIKNILSAAAVSVTVAFFVTSCGMEGGTSETDEHALASSVDEICATGTEEECEASYEALYEDSYGGGEDHDFCKWKCQKTCEKNCKHDNPGCKQRCKSHCKKVCGKDKDHAVLEVY